MKKIIACLLFFSSFVAQAQLLDSIALDTVRTYTSLESALKHPDKVYKLKLQKEGLKEFPKEIFQFKNLQVLDLSKNRIRELPPEIGQLTYLQTLSLSKNRIVTIPHEIGNLTHLRVLILNQNEIDSLPKEMGNLRQLIYLDLWSNNLSYFPLELKNLTTLRELDLRHIQLNQKEQDYIKMLLPKTKIWFSPSCNCN